MEKPWTKRRMLGTLFLTTLYISSVTFGGGFVIVTFMKRKFVDELHWMEETEMLDLTALAQSAPGAIAVNAAILVGWRMAGFWGMAAAVLGTILPPMVLLSLLSLVYGAVAENRWIALTLRGMQAGVTAVILDVALGMGRTVVKGRSTVEILILTGAFLAAFLFRVHALLILLAAAAVGIGRILWQKRRGRTA